MIQLKTTEANQIQTRTHFVMETHFWRLSPSMHAESSSSPYQLCGQVEKQHKTLEQKKQIKQKAEVS